jgi:hypothetical protein
MLGLTTHTYDDARLHKFKPFWSRLRLHIYCPRDLALILVRETALN